MCSFPIIFVYFINIIVLFIKLSTQNREGKRYIISLKVKIPNPVVIYTGAKIWAKNFTDLTFFFFKYTDNMSQVNLYFDISTLVQQ